MVKVDKDIQEGVIGDWKRDPGGVERELRKKAGDKAYNDIMSKGLTPWLPALIITSVAIFRQFEREEQQWKERLTKMDLSKILWL